MHAPRRLSPATLKGRRHKAFVGLDGRINYTRAVADDTISSKHCVRLQHEPTDMRCMGSSARKPA